MKRRLRRGGCVAWRQTAFTVEVDVPTRRAIARADMPVGSRSRICSFLAALIGRQAVLRMPRAVAVSLLSSVDATLAVLDSGATSPALRRLRKASRGSQLFGLMLPRCTNKSLPSPTSGQTSQMESTLSTTWVSLYEAAKAVQRPRHVSSYIEAGGVAAAVESSSGRIYTGVCVDTACTLGICAERNAILNMVTNGEDAIRRVLTIMRDGRTGPPCGACREMMTQLMPSRFGAVEVMIDYEAGKTMTLADLTPQWWLRR